MGLLNFAAAEATRQGLDPDLVLRVLNTESGGNPRAVSPKGARGPMQLMPGTARDLGVNIDNPEDNIRGGVRYLKQQLDAFGTPELALAAYNAGPGNVRKYGGVPPFRETQNYVQKTVGGRMEFDGSDIFGMGDPSTAAPQAPAQGGGDFDGSAIFAAPAPAAPPVAQERTRGPQRSLGPGGYVPVGLPRVTVQKDQGLGFQKGAMTPMDNAALAIETGVNKVGSVFGRPTAGADFARSMGGPSALDAANSHAAYLAAQAQKGRVPAKIGEFAGNVVGTLPAAIATKNPFIGGAASGALLTDKRDMMGVGTDALIGGVSGLATNFAMGLVGKALKGGDKAVRELLDRGVPLTPGQVLGGTARRVEDKLISVPGVGDIIAGKQGATIPALNRAGADDVLSSIGQKVPAGVDVGHDSVAYVGKTVSDSYNKLLKPLTVKLDPEFARGLQALAPDIASLSAADQGQIHGILQHQVARRLGTGPVTGEKLKGVESYLTGKVSEFYKNPDKAEMASVLYDVQQTFRDMLARQNPAAAASLKAHNLAYAKLIRLEGAAANAVDGVASPAQLKAAVTRGAGRRYAARGEGLMQDLANAGAKVIPAKVPDSGSGGRLLQATIPGALSALATSPLLPFYSGGGQKLVAGLFGSSRPPAAKALAQLLSQLKAPAIAGGAALTMGAKRRDQPTR